MVLISPDSHAASPFLNDLEVIEIDKALLITHLAVVLEIFEPVSVINFQNG